MVFGVSPCSFGEWQIKTALDAGLPTTAACRTASLLWCNIDFSHSLIAVEYANHQNLWD
jgi:hypothetical protein